MLFLRDSNESEQPKAVYLLGDDMEAMLVRHIELCLREHGYPTGEHGAVGKDMAFLRAKRLLLEQLNQQLWLLAVRAIVISGAALLLLGLKRYLGL